MNIDLMINRITHGLNVSTDKYRDKVHRMVSGSEPNQKIYNTLYNTALEYMQESDTDWTYVASRAYLRELYEITANNRGNDPDNPYTQFYGLQVLLATKGVYSYDILQKYSREEIERLAQIIEPERDELFDYLGLFTLADRYLTTDFNENLYELPQERWLTIALHLMQDEKPEFRHEYVKEAYWALSNLYMTVATPTLSNAGKSHSQLSSCFIDTVDDDLWSIYDSNTNIAKLSGNGGGIGVYMGKIRAEGSAIRGYKNRSSGVVPWIKQLNNTAVSVDQLGTRQGAIAVYLDIWHADIEAFLDLRLNNGDPRKRAHDIFLGVNLPDLFMEQVENRGDWYLFDPHEVEEKMGFKLEDSFDEENGYGSFRNRYYQCVNNDNLSKEKVPAIDLMKRIMRSQLETGTPFMFYRDEVNRQNPNKVYNEDGTAKTTIYSSNLCTEITQNMSPSQFVAEYTDSDGMVVRKYTPGDYVVCNLSSINLGTAVPDGVLQRLIPIQMRMLDNVISVNTLPLEFTKLTNQRYRAVGLGTFGWHQLLAKENVQWESDEAVELSDRLYEEIAYEAIKASNMLAKEKGSYEKFDSSEWADGKYFERKGYIDETGNTPQARHDWKMLAENVQIYGMRNGYLMAVAPNGSTSIIANSTASIDPIFDTFYYEEKRNYKIPKAAPELDHHTYNVYRRTAYVIDQRESVRQNAARQKHVDQSISFNIYVPHNIKASALLDVHLQAWRLGLKTTYYIRSSASDIPECEWCEG